MVDQPAILHDSNCATIPPSVNDVIASIEPVDTEEIVNAELVQGQLSSTHQRISPWLRWLCLLSGIGVMTLLAIARSLTPSPLGHGTHQQLGLPPCTSILLWNKPCPACGMTTSWALATRGDLGLAASTNVGGLLLAIIALAFFPASCYFFATGRATRGYWFSTLLTVSLVTAMALAIVQWLVRLLG
jgi:Protein of unknown function (DUF2752)